MLTWDFPSLCKTCMFTDLPAPERYLPFAGEALDRLGRKRQTVECTLEVDAPAHMLRQEAAPVFRVRPPAQTVERWFLALALGGEADALVLHEMAPSPDDGGMLELELPAGEWEALRSNLGHWWAVFGLGAERSFRSAEIRCLVRHEPVARIAGSDLRYPDQGHRAVVDLGGGKEAGWGERHSPQARPRLGERHTLEWKSAGRRRSNGNSENGRHPMSKGEYARLVARVRTVVGDSLPAGSSVCVISKGDDALLELDCAEAWHFPVGPEGEWAGFHPIDGNWAIEHLEALRACGADYLLIPAASTWWLERYPEFAEHLTFHYPAVCDDPACVIFALGRFPAFYGRKRDAAVNGFLNGSA
jgi:hypothetical protein